MTANRSSNASRYGSLAETRLAGSRDLDLDGTHTSWCDARFQNGTPVEIKAAMYSTGYFQIYQKYHERLRENDGWYGFVVYKPQGQGIRVMRERMVQAHRLPLSAMWSPTGGHRDTEKAKVQISEVFG